MHCICNTVNNNRVVSAICDDIDISHGCKGFITTLICMTSRHQYNPKSTSVSGWYGYDIYIKRCMIFSVCILFKRLVSLLSNYVNIYKKNCLEYDISYSLKNIKNISHSILPVYYTLLNICCEFPIVCLCFCNKDNFFKTCVLCETIWLI